MSLLPYLIDDLLDVPTPRRRCIWESPNDWLYATGLCPYTNAVNAIEKKSLIGKDGFQVTLDVQHFAPEEISVKTVDNSIVIDAKHEEKQDEHGFVSRQFQRRYFLPKEINIKDVVSTISSDGILTVKAPPAKPALEGSNVRQIKIEQTGPARLKSNEKQDKSDSKAVKETK